MNIRMARQRWGLCYLPPKWLCWHWNNHTKELSWVWAEHPPSFYQSLTCYPSLLLLWQRDPHKEQIPWVPTATTYGPQVMRRYSVLPFQWLNYLEQSLKKRKILSCSFETPCKLSRELPRSTTSWVLRHPYILFCKRSIWFPSLN